MKTSSFSFSAFTLGGLLLATALSGCAMTAGGSPAPQSTVDTSRSAPRVAWLDPSSFVIQTDGTACEPVIDDLIAGDQSIEVVFATSETADCATDAKDAGQGDAVPRGTYLGLSAGLDSSRPLTVVVTETDGKVTELTLPGLSEGEVAPADRMPEQRPAVAWIADGELAVLTWGSSTCVPQSGSVDVVSDTEALVRLDESENDICTMDLVPRVTFVSAPGLAADASFTLVGQADADGAPVVVTPVS